MIDSEAILNRYGWFTRGDSSQYLGFEVYHEELGLGSILNIDPKNGRVINVHFQSGAQKVPIDSLEFNLTRHPSASTKALTKAA